MFYMFHHIPKCGGTSFNRFLGQVFDLLPDYHNPGGPQADAAKFQKYRAEPKNLAELKETSCIAGHYNIEGIHLWQRYPELEKLPHRKFSVMREPFATARSGVYFQIKRGRASPAEPSEIRRRILARANIIARTFGIAREDQIDAVLDRYWFVCPLERLHDGARAIEAASGRSGGSLERVNTTEKPKEEPDSTLEDEFRQRSALDYALYLRVCDRFRAFFCQTSVAARATLGEAI